MQLTCLYEGTQRPSPKQLRGAIERFRKARRVDPKMKPQLIAYKYGIDLGLFGAAVRTGRINTEQDADAFIDWYHNKYSKYKGVDFDDVLDWVKGLL